MTGSPMHVVLKSAHVKNLRDGQRNGGVSSRRTHGKNPTNDIAKFCWMYIQSFVIILPTLKLIRTECQANLS